MFYIFCLAFELFTEHGVRHGQKSGRANTEYIVYKNYNSF